MKTEPQPIYWTEILPKVSGWYWLHQSFTSQVVYVDRQRAYGGRLCTQIGMVFYPIEEIENSLWAGPLPKPIEPMKKKTEYPNDWDLIAKGVKEKAHWKCERCGHANDIETGHVLTVHHLDGNKKNCSDWNLAALCQRCHLTIQGRVRMDQMFFMEILDVSEWFKPHLEGYLKSKE